MERWGLDKMDTMDTGGDRGYGGRQGGGKREMARSTSWFVVLGSGCCATCHEDRVDVWCLVYGSVVAALKFAILG